MSNKAIHKNKLNVQFYNKTIKSFVNHISLYCDKVL